MCVCGRGGILPYKVTNLGFLWFLLLSSRLRSQQGLIWSKYYSFHYVFWIVDSLATELGLMIHHHNPECLAKKNWLLHSRSRSQHRVKMLMFRWYLPNHLTFCFQTWYCDSSSWVRVSCRKIGLLFSWSMSQQGLIWSKYDNFYCIFWTADPFATKHGLIVHYHKPAYLTEKLDCCV